MKNFGLKFTFGIILLMLFLEIFIITIMFTGKYTSPLCIDGSLIKNLSIGQS